MLEEYFKKFRKNIIGKDAKFQSPYGIKKIVYSDWTASGRMYKPIEDRLAKSIAPYVGNTHTETTITGSAMTKAYHKALNIIKKHVGAYESDIIISSNSGMTGVINKFQRILGLKIHEKYKNKVKIPKQDRPVIFVSHMEHHSNQTSWIETIGEVIVIPANKDGLVDLDEFENLLKKYSDRNLKIAAVTSCSNVTGISTPYHDIARIIHQYDGLCFVDFAASAPYINICMRCDNDKEHLDALYFSPHKFLGGPGSSGVLIFDQKLYSNKIPDEPGGGTVDWTNPWGEHKYIDDIETREDGGTPSFLQTMKVALCIKLKNEMTVENILAREKEQLDIIFREFDKIPNLAILANNHRERLGIVSFYIEGLHYNLAVKLLNDRFGVQVRGGCSCAGTYGHYLLDVSQEDSKNLTDMISCGILSEKPGWVRMSVHPTMTDREIKYICSSIKKIAKNYEEWSKDYTYNPRKNEYYYQKGDNAEDKLVDSWFADNLS